MARRMLTVITGQPLVNFIAINEPSTQPDVVHCLVTPAMTERARALKEVASRLHPAVEFEEHEIASELDSAQAHEIGKNLLDKYKIDEWVLNRTTGTEQLRAPLADLFDMDDRRRSFFVETGKGRLAFPARNWSYAYHLFESGIQVKDYFALHGQTVTAGREQHWTEGNMVEALKKLAFFDVLPYCTWIGADNPEPLAEYDCAATADYRLFLFERKDYKDPKDDPHLRDGQREAARKNKKSNIRHDIEKLTYSRLWFGGPFGKVFWVFSGSFPLSEVVLRKIDLLGVHRVRLAGKKFDHNHWKELGLPPPRGQG